MIALAQVDLLGLFVEPAVICLVLALAISALLRRIFDRIGIDRWVWNRALFDVCILTAITALLILSLRVPGG